MSKVNRDKTVIISLAPRGAGRDTGKMFLSIGQLIDRSQTLRTLAKTIGGLQPFNELIRLEGTDKKGTEKSYAILQRFIINLESIASEAELALCFFACGRHMLISNQAGKFSEVFPDRVDRPELQKKWGDHLKAVRRIGHDFAYLGLSAEEARSFIEQVSPRFFPLLVHEPFRANEMLKVETVKDMIAAYGFVKFMNLLASAAANKPVNLEEEIIRLA